MARWVLNAVPTWLLAVAVLGGFVALAVGGERWVRRRYPAAAEGKYHDAASSLLQVILVLFGFVLGFAIVLLYQNLNDARISVEQEATSVALLTRDISVFDAEVIADINPLLDEYVHEVVDDEWEAMANGEPSYGGYEIVSDLFGALARWEPGSIQQQVYYEEAIANLNAAVGDRRTRLARAQEGLPFLFYLLIVTGAISLIVCLWMLGEAHVFGRTWMTAFVGLLIGLNLFLVLTLDHPYSGDFAVSPQPFKEGALRVFWVPEHRGGVFDR